ncbi:cell division protein ZapA [Agitococcus lubricus]|uniref:Cell division protein ZapA n=1 Tax=Agitococcus lubricus TaxID=1077255 RepID=A0A2T5IVG4_9GAMM|nr:cell division protein ZapA [Agitococcus lubricus]PTQ87853.1 cell division protein ZapA [Agitococcus lubricus]
MSIETVEITILDKVYRIQSPANEQETLKKAAVYLDEKMREIRNASRSLESDRVAVLAALNICHELFERNQQADTAQKIGQALQILTTKIDKALAN